MPKVSVLPHLQNYARLRPAVAGDVEALAGLHHLIAAEQAFPEATWRLLVGSRAARVTLALEGGVIVGMGVELHRPRAAIARLLWLGVDPSARGRGVGHLLLETIIEQAQAEGAAVIVASARTERAFTVNMLVEAGFKADAGPVSRYRKSLWSPRRVPSCNGTEAPYYPHVGDSSSGVCCLMMAMAGIDNGVILSGRVESVLHHEILSKKLRTANGEGLGLAAAATRRGFEVLVHNGGMQDAAKLDGIVIADGLPTPEQMIGHLSRGQVPMIHCSFRRLHGQRPARWLLVAGFDGYLFRTVDPEMPLDGCAVTIGEMRAMLKAAPAALVVSRPGS